MASLLGSALTGGASLLSGALGGKDASKAAQIGANAYTQGVQAQQNEFNQIQSDYAPYRAAGTSALGAESNLLGLGGTAATPGTTDWSSYVQNQPDLAAEWQKVQGDPRFGGSEAAYGQWHYNTYGQNEGRSLTPYTSGGTPAVSANDAQQSSISQLQQSPLYTSLYQSGLNSVLNNAAATGGLRGGNATSSLYNLGNQTLAQVIQNQLSNLSGVSGQGLNAVSGTSSAGTSTANSISNLLGQQGAANATASAAPTAGLLSGITGAANAYGNYSSGQSLANLLSSNSALGGASLGNTSGLGSPISVLSGYNPGFTQQFG